jgi:hypothetical protein
LLENTVTDTYSLTFKDVICLDQILIRHDIKLVTHCDGSSRLLRALHWRGNDRCDIALGESNGGTISHFESEITEEITRKAAVKHAFRVVYLAMAEQVNRCVTR